MIVKTKGNEVRGDLSLDSGESSISQEKVHKIMGLLVKQYSDPLGTILREYSSNIYDSYIGTNKKPHGIVSLYEDTDKQQWYLSFKDNGSGISPQMFKEIFIIYGESTKDTSDSFIGGYGLGSKSAFSYTDSFFIITRSEGVLYNYYYYKGDKGTPKYDLLSKKETDEENGTEIKIPIKRQDVYTLKTKVKQLMYFDNLFIEGFGYSNDYKLIEGKYFKYKEGTSERLHVCLEKVYYPLPQDFIDEYRNRHNLSRYGDDIFNFPLAIKFNNGELEPTISRENFEYNEEVYNLLEERINKVSDELKELYLSKNKIHFDKDYPLLEFFNLNNSNLNIEFPSDIYLQVNNIWDIKFSHELLKNYDFKGYDLAESFKMNYKLHNNSFISQNHNCDLRHLEPKKTYFKDETVSTKSMKAAYIREQYYDIRIVSLNTPSLKFYRNRITILVNKPKDKWRDIIKAYQACVQNIQNSLPLYSSIEVPLDFEKRYKNRNKKNKNSEDIKVTFINEARNFARYGNKVQTMHYKELYNVNTVFIYGEQKHKEKLEEIAELFKFQRFINYEPIYIRKMDLEKVENANNFIHIEDLEALKYEKIIKNVIREYQKSKFQDKWSNIIYVLKGFNDNLVQSYTKNISTYRGHRDDLLEALINKLPEYKDISIDALDKQLEEYFKGIEILKYVNPSSDEDFKITMVKFLRNNKKKLNNEYYFKLTGEEEQWLQDWKQSNDYFITNNKQRLYNISYAQVKEKENYNQKHLNNKNNLQEIETFKKLQNELQNN